MSAFVHDRAHILALTRTAVEGPSDPRDVRPDNVWHGPAWYAIPTRELRELGWRKADLYARRATWESAEDIARLLYDENVASVRYRYGDADETGMIGDEPPFTMAEIRRARRLSVADALHALASFEYQSCEHDEWQDGEALRFCDAFRRSLCSVISRDSDCWAIRDEVPA